MSIPLGVVASRRPKLSEYLLGIAGILQTIPTLALLVLMVPLLGGAIGFLPAFIALTLYSLLPILANTITGIRGIDPTLTEAARGLGMSDWQMLRRVQLPLAAPIILSGIRTATVLIVGTATLATPVGGTSLGNYIFSGLEMNNNTWIVFGCVFTALFAILLDQLVHLLELAVARRNRRLAWIAAAGLSLVIVAGLYRPVARLLEGPPDVVIASAPFTEQYILSALMRMQLAEAGLSVDQRQGMGETIQFCALQHGKIDCCVNYTGNIWVTQMKRTTEKDRGASREQIYAETRDFLERQGIVCLGRVGFENRYMLVMHRKHGITSIKQMAQVKGLRIAGDRQFFARPEWMQLRDTYQLAFSRTRSMDPSLILPAIESDKVDVICAYSSDGRIDERFVVLEDDERVLPAYDAVLLLSAKAARKERLVAALRPLLGTLDDATMKSANAQVDTGKRSALAMAQELYARVKGR